MIEPQNTMMPQAAESRPVKAPDGDATGFGEMLAESLGLVAQVDPDAVRQIAIGNQSHHQPPGGELSELIGDDVDSPASASLMGAVVPDEVTAPSVAAEPVPAAGGIGDPVPATAETPAQDSNPGRTLPATSVSPGRTLPTTPLSMAVPNTTESVNDTWEPVLADYPEAALLPAVPRDGVVVTPDAPAPVDSIGVPILTADPDAETSPSPVAGERADLPPAAEIDPSHNPPVEPAPVAPIPSGIPRPSVPARPTPDRELPVAPAPTNAPAAPVAVPPSTEAMAPTGGPVSPMESRVDLVSDIPVRIDGSHRVVMEPAPVTAHETGTLIANDTGAVAVQPIPAAPAAEVGSPATTFVQNAPDVPRPQASALAERVMHAIDLQRTQPPPRSMVVDIPEIEGLRLVVSVGSTGQVHVAAARGSADADSLSPFMDDLSRVLGERGFVMSGDGRRRGHNPHPAEEPAPFHSRRPTFRRPVRADNDLRI